METLVKNHGHKGADVTNTNKIEPKDSNKSRIHSNLNVNSESEIVYSQSSPNTTKKTKTKLKLKDTKNSESKVKKQTIINLNSTSIPSAKKYIIDYPFKAIKHETEKSMVLYIFKKFLVVLLNFSLIIPISLYLGIVISLSYLFKLTFKLFHICHLTSASKYQESIPEFLSPIELFWLLNSNLIDDAKFKNQSETTGSCLFFIEGHVTKTNLKNLINTRILSAEKRLSTRNFVRFRQRLYNLWAYGFVWLDCDEATFDIDDHIAVIDDSENAIKNENDLQSYMTGLINNHEFNIEKPLWKIYCKHNFPLNDGTPSETVERGTVIIFLFHMCFADGVSLIRLFFKSLVDNRNSIDLKPRFAASSMKFEFIQQFFFNLCKIFTNLIFQRPDKNPLHRDSFQSRIFKRLNNSFESSKPMLKDENWQNNRKGKSKEIMWSKPFNSVNINRLKLVTRTKANDFMLSLVGGIIRDYLQNKGINNPQDMHCLMPINLSCNKYPFKLGNMTTLSTLRLPTNTEGAIPMLWMTRTETTRIKNTGDYFFFYFFLFIVFKSVPNRFAAFLTRCLVNKNTLVATSLGTGDASLNTASLCNHNVRSIIFINPTFCKIGISFSIVTYGEEVRLAITTDSEMFINPEFIITEFNKKLEMLTKLLSGRRIPGEIRRPTRCLTTTNDGNSETSIINEQAIDQMHTKLNQIYNEIQLLSEYCEKLDPNSVDFNNLKQLAYIKREKFKREFRVILSTLHERNSANQQISSDEEEELNIVDRVRLRSSSVISKESSSRSNSNSRKPSVFSSGSNKSSNSCNEFPSAAKTSKNNISTELQS